MKSNEYTALDATELAQLVKSNQIKAEELVEIAISQIEKHNPQINAVVNKFYDDIETQLKNANPQAPFYGVPFLIKDLGLALNGKTLTSSSKFMKDYRPDFDSILIQKYKNAGFIILGQTNTPELGLLGITESKFRGPCRNPWSLGHTPGGSSGGSAAAVASGMVPAASAGDGGGSIRIPASACNLFGLKPSRGLVPFGPSATESWLGLVSLHCLTKTVRDSAALLDIEADTDIGAPYASPQFKESFLKATKRNSKKLKIAYYPGSLLGHSLTNLCSEAVDNTTKILKQMGHEVVRDKPQFDKYELRRAYTIIVASCVATEIESMSKLVGREASANDFEVLTWFLKQVSESYKASDLAWALEQSRKFGSSLGQFFSKYDLFCTSTLGSLPVKVGSFDLSPVEKIVFQTLKYISPDSALHTVLTQMSERGFESSPNTQLFNLSGTPAMSVPLALGFESATQTHLPLGIQFCAAFGKDDLLFDIAAQLEQTELWVKNKAPLC